MGTTIRGCIGALKARPGQAVLVALAAFLVWILAILPIVVLALWAAEATMLGNGGIQARRRGRVWLASAVRLALLALFSVPLLGAIALIGPLALLDALGVPGLLHMPAVAFVCYLAGNAAALWLMGLRGRRAIFGPAMLGAVAAGAFFGLLHGAAESWAGDALAFTLAELTSVAAMRAALIGPQTHPAPAPATLRMAGDVTGLIRLALTLARGAPILLAVVILAPLADFVLVFMLPDPVHAALLSILPSEAAWPAWLLCGIVEAVALGQMLGRPRVRAFAAAAAALFLRMTLRHAVTFVTVVLGFGFALSDQTAVGQANLILVTLFILAMPVGNLGGFLALSFLARLMAHGPGAPASGAGRAPAGQDGAVLLLIGLGLVQLGLPAALISAIGGATGAVLGLAIFGLAEALTLAVLAGAALAPGDGVALGLAPARPAAQTEANRGMQERARWPLSRSPRAKRGWPRSDSTGPSARTP